MFIQQLGSSSREAGRTRLSPSPQVQTLAESWAQGAYGPHTLSQQRWPAPHVRSGQARGGHRRKESPSLVTGFKIPGLLLCLLLHCSALTASKCSLLCGPGVPQTGQGSPR